MRTVVAIYCHTLHTQLQELFAVWPIGQHVAIGDYGLIGPNSVFKPLANIAKHGIDAPVDPPATRSKYEYKSAGCRTVALQANAGGNASGSGNAQGRVAIEFERKESVFFIAASCRITTVKDKIALGDQIFALYGKKKWQPEWAVVTSVVNAGRTTALVATDAGASIQLEADGATDGNVNLADARIGAKVRAGSERHIGLNVVGEPGQTPLIGLSKIHLKFGASFLPKNARRFGFRGTRVPEISKIRSFAKSLDRSPEDLLYFGDVIVREANPE